MIAAPNSVVFYFVLFSVVICVLDIILNHQQDKTSRIPGDYLWAEFLCQSVTSCDFIQCDVLSLSTAVSDLYKQHLQNE